MSTTEIAAFDRPALQGREPPRLRLVEAQRSDVLERGSSPRSVELPLMAMDAVVLLAAAFASSLAEGQAREVFGLACLAFASLVLRGAYRPRLRQVALDGVAHGLVSVALGGIATYALFALMAPQGAKAPAGPLGFAMLLAATTVVAGRVVLTAIQRHSRVRRGALRPVIIVGTGEVGQQIAERLAEHPEYGLRPAGFVDADPYPLAAADEDLPPFVGGPTALEEALERTGARHVIVAFTTLSDGGLMSLIRRSHALGVDVSVVPRFFDSMNEGISLEHLGGLPLLRLSAVDPRGWGFVIKHATDRFVAGVVLLAIAPVFLALTLGVRLSSPGPIFFRQRRMGRDGQVFDVLKFRSMAPPPADADEFRPEAGSAPGGVEGVDRRTRIGKLMRRTSLDELPQLLNVMRGDMSLVGPRPERPEFVELFGRDLRRYDERHRVKSGITGWAQVHGLRGQTSIAKRVEWDNYYIENWSLWLDVKTVLLTFKALFAAAE